MTTSPAQTAVLNLLQSSGKLPMAEILPVLKPFFTFEPYARDCVSGLVRVGLLTRVMDVMLGCHVYSIAVPGGDCPTCDQSGVVALVGVGLDTCPTCKGSGKLAEATVITPIVVKYQPARLGRNNTVHYVHDDGSHHPGSNPMCGAGQNTKGSRKRSGRPQYTTDPVTCKRCLKKAETKAIV
jgi:hypothetical protein